MNYAQAAPVKKGSFVFTDFLSLAYNIKINENSN